MPVSRKPRHTFLASASDHLLAQRCLHTLRRRRGRMLGNRRQAPVSTQTISSATSSTRWCGLNVLSLDHLSFEDADSHSPWRSLMARGAGKSSDATRSPHNRRSATAVQDRPAAPSLRENLPLALSDSHPPPTFRLRGQDRSSSSGLPVFELVAAVGPMQSGASLVVIGARDNVEVVDGAWILRDARKPFLWTPWIRPLRQSVDDRALRRSARLVS